MKSPTGFEALTDVLAQREPAGVTRYWKRGSSMRTHSRCGARNGKRSRRKNGGCRIESTAGRPVTAPRLSGSQPKFVQVSLQTLLDAARKNAFDIRIREAELAQQGFKVALSKNERYPAIAFGPFYSQENAADKEPQAGIGFPCRCHFGTATLEIFRRARRVSNRRELRCSRQSAKWNGASHKALRYQAKREEIEKWQADTIAKFRETSGTSRSELPPRRRSDLNLRRNAKAISRSARRRARDKEGCAASGTGAGNPYGIEALQERGTAMIDKILEFSVRQRVLVLMGALALLLVGLWSANKLPMDAIPDITGVQVQVNTTVPALAPDEVEKLVTMPLEMALGGVAGVTEMRSLSRFGLSQITLQFTDKSDIYRARQLVTERLQSAADSLPPGLTPKLIPITTGLGEVFYYTIDYSPNAPNGLQRAKRS